MRKFNDIAFSAILCSMVIALFITLFAPVCLADMESNAKREFESMSAVEISDPASLDQFIRKYPNTQQARMAFVLRYTLLATAPSIQDYNEFINRYEDKDIVPIAIHEVYKLYCEQNRASGYYDFVARYPGSHQAIVATERLQQLFFEYVCLLDTEEDYDGFISLFPDAPQVEAALEKAKIKAVEAEKKEFDAFNKSSETPDIKRFISGKISIWEQKVNQYTRNKDYTDNASRLQLYQIIRGMDVFYEVYGNDPAMSRVSRKFDSLNTQTLLRDIKIAIEKNHKELLAKLDEETDRICDGLKQLHQDNIRIIEEIRNGFKTLHQDLINIHQELKDINLQLVKVNANLEQLRNDVNANFERLDKKLDVINQNLINVQTAVTQSAMATNQVLREEFSRMNKTVEIGFNKQAVMLGRMNDTMVNGFNETNKRLFGIGQQIDKLDKDMVDGFGRVQSSLGVIGQKLDHIDSNMQAGFSGLSQQLNVLDNHMIAGFSEVGQRIDNMDAHMQAGMSALNNNMNAMRQEMGEGFSGLRQDMRDGFNRVCSTVYEATASVNQSLSVLHNDINEVNSNVIAGNQMIGNMHKDMVQGFENQAQISREILRQNEIQSDRLNEIKDIAYSGFNDINSKLDSPIAFQRSAQTLLNAQDALQQALPSLQLSLGGDGQDSGSISSLVQSFMGDSNKGQIIGNAIETGVKTGSKTKAVSAGIGTAAALYVGSFCPAAAPIVQGVATKVSEGVIRGGKKLLKKIFGSVDRFDVYAFDELPMQFDPALGDEFVDMSFHENAYRVLFTAYQEADEDDAELKEALMKMVFNEDKRRVLYAAVQLASVKRPYPVFPKNLEDLVLNAKNPDELKEAILPLAVYCGVSPEALTFAAQYIF